MPCLRPLAMRLINWLFCRSTLLRSYELTMGWFADAAVLDWRLPFFCRYWKAFELALLAFILDADWEKAGCVWLSIAFGA